MTKEEAAMIEAKLRYLYDDPGPVSGLFDRLLTERMAGLYGERHGNIIAYNGQSFRISPNPNTFFNETFRH